MRFAEQLHICYGHYINRDRIIATLRAHETELRQRRVNHAALPGSVAHDQAAPASDIDILIELEPGAALDVCEDVAVAHGSVGDRPASRSRINYVVATPPARRAVPQPPKDGEVQFAR